MNPLHPAISLRAGRRCEYCRAPEVLANFLFEIEHIVPQSAGGTDATTNLALACRSCNAHKSARQAAVDPTTGNRVALFHPRQDSWSDHFAINTQTNQIEGQTETGRATVAALQMNSPAQLEARHLWTRLLLFP
jgi:5-methylcytosine-specific restriction endonuclease McrA